MNNNRLHPLLYILPFGLLFFVSHEFFNKGHLNLFEDAKDICIYMNYFLNHMTRGVYPFWNPFSSWGRPDDLLVRMIGEFNPFLYMIAVLQKLGMGFSIAYVGYLIIYFTVGIAGVYFLAKQLFQDPLIVWLVYVSAMFSNLGNLFNNIFVILIFVPTVWFFYFLIKFTRNPQRADLLGLIFCVMIILTTYMPFHFLVIFLTFLMFYLCIYALEVPAIIHRYIIFISKNRLFTLFCLFSLFLSTIPGFLWYQSNLKGDVIFGARGFQHSLTLDKTMIDSGSFIGMHTLISPISHLQDAQLYNLYIPFIFILIGLLGMVLPLNRRRLLLFAVGLFIYLLTTTNASPLTGFLYQHVFFFKYFRNPHFFVWAFGMFVILLAADLFDGLLSLQLKNNYRRIGLCVFVIMLHLSVLIFLNRYWEVNRSSYTTLGLSCILFVFYFAGILKRSNILFFLLVSVVFFLQSIEVLRHVDHKLVNQQVSYTFEPSSDQDFKPTFAYQRPSFDEEASMIDTQHLGDISDQSGFIKADYLWRYLGTRWSSDLLRNFPFRKDLEEYVRHKFVLYGPHQNVSLGPSDDFPVGEWIDSDSNQFKVTAFDMNYIRLKTAFTQDQLLVYNDSFHPDWLAFINGHRVSMIRANAAFKGIYLPAGNNEVLFSFHTPFYRGFFIFLIIYFDLILIILVFLFVRRGKHALVS